MIIEFLQEETFLHRLDIRSKIIGFAGIMVLLFAFQDPLYNLGIAGLTFLLAVNAKMPFKKILNLLIPLLPIFVLIIIFSGFNYNEAKFYYASHKEVLFYLLPEQKMAGVSVGGILTGLTFLVRLITLVIASAVVTLTTPIEDFIQLLNKLKLPYEISFVVATALRFIPTLAKKKDFIIDAQRARGAQVNGKGIIGHVKHQIPIMVPMMVNSILMANTLSMSMLNRGFGYSRAWTNLREISFGLRDLYALAITVAIVAIGLYLRFALNRGVL